MNLGPLNRRVRFEEMVREDDANYGSQPGDWVPVATLWANVQDVLPSRAEQATAIVISSRPARVRVRYRTGLTSDMRMVIEGPTERTLKIVSGPAELGWKQGLEFMGEEFSTAGDVR